MRLQARVIRADGGATLVGAAPVRVLRLTPRAAELLADRVLTVTDAGTSALAERLLAANVAEPVLDHVAAPSPDDLTVVLPVRDRAPQLDRALTALHAARCLVVDDASERPDAVAAVARLHGAELLPLATNVGPAGARNAGLDQVTTPYVAFVDCDVQVTLSTLLTLARHFTDPAVTLVGPRIEGTSVSRSPRWFEQYDATESSLTLGHQPSTVHPGSHVAWLPSACLVGRTADLRDVRFDEEMRVGEDVDLVWRLAGRGDRVRYDPSAVARHETRSTVRGWLGRKFLYGTGGAALAARHGDKLAPAVLSPTYAIAAAAVLGRSRWSLAAGATAVAFGTRAVRARLPRSRDRDVLALRLATRGLVWAVRQESALAVRHWWPLAVAAAPSRTVRRALATAVVVDSAVAVVERRQATARSGIPTTLAARRLDDLAYGAGLWWGAARARSVRALLPRRP